MNESTPITFTWITKRGAHNLERIKWSDLEARTKRAFDLRLRVEAWFEDNRDEIVAQVFKRNGRWIWWSEVEPGTVTF